MVEKYEYESKKLTDNSQGSVNIVGRGVLILIYEDPPILPSPSFFSNFVHPLPCTVTSNPNFLLFSFFA